MRKEIKLSCQTEKYKDAGKAQQQFCLAEEPQSCNTTVPYFYCILGTLAQVSLGAKGPRVNRLRVNSNGASSLFVCSYIDGVTCSPATVM